MAMMTLTDVQHEARQRALKTRAAMRATSNLRFERAFAVATDAQKMELPGILRAEDPLAALRHWVKRAGPTRTFETMTTRELKMAARNALVAKYSRLTRDQLIRALEKGRPNATSMGDAPDPAS